MRLLNNRKGLTLIELLIVVIILGALAAIAIPRISTSSATAKEKACLTNIATMNTQLELYYADNESYPALADLVADANYFPDGEPNCPSGGTYTLTGDSRVSCSTHGTL
ncbi:MAG: prepilin-type N-terminal cleavage/methylation domain-containing protein [Phycisphaerae bacterium]|jgi:competence protein ComGC